jgi:hypothetical protein
MIKTKRENDTPKIAVQFDLETNPKLDEVGMAIYELERAKHKLLSLDFQTDFSMKRLK